MYVDDATDKTKVHINETLAEKILRCGCKPNPKRPKPDVTLTIAVPTATPAVTTPTVATPTAVIIPTVTTPAVVIPKTTTVATSTIITPTAAVPTINILRKLYKLL